MKPKNFSLYYDSLLEKNPYFFDDYFDENQILEIFMKDSALKMLESSFEPSYSQIYC